MRTTLRRLLLLSLLACPGLAAAQLSTNLPLIVNGSTSSAQSAWAGGAGFFGCVGTFSGATVTLQYLGPDGATLLTVGASTTLTTNGGATFSLPRVKVQATVSGGAPSGLYCTAWSIPTLIG